MKGQSQQSGRTQAPSTGHAYANVTVTVFEYNATTQENKSQGQYTLLLKPVTGATNFTIFRPGCSAALMSFNLSRQINWTLQNNVYVYFTDPRNVQWLLQFPDAVSAAQTTAVIGILLSVTSGKDIAQYEAQQLVKGTPVQEGDTIQLSFWVFTFQPFPFPHQCVASKESFTTTLTRDKLATGLVSGLIGMMVGNTRIVYVPQRYSMLNTGRDPMFPDANLVVVVSLLSKVVETPAETPAQTEPAQQQTSPSRAAPQSVINTSDLGVIVMDDATPLHDTESDGEPAAEELDPETEARIRTMERIRRMGGKAEAFAAPIPIRPRDDATQRTAMSQYPDRRAYQPVPGLSAMIPAPSGAPAQTNDPSKSPFDNRFDNIERSIEMKLEAMTGAGTDAGAVVSGVTSLVSYVRLKQQEVDRLKAELERERAAASRQVSAQSLETVKREGERIQKANADMEQSLVEIQSKVKDLEAALSSSGATAIGREKTLMKRLMSNVFDEVQGAFEEKKHYSGAQVGDLLRKLMREQSFAILKDIEENGLF